MPFLYICTYIHIAKLEINWLSLSCYVYPHSMLPVLFFCKCTLEGISLYRRATAVQLLA